MIKNITTTIKWRNLVNKVKGKPSNEQNVINDKLLSYISELEEQIIELNDKVSKLEKQIDNFKDYIFPFKDNYKED